MVNRFQLDFQVEESSILRAFLQANDISKRTLTAVKYEGGKILVNGEEKNVRCQLNEGDRVTVIFPPEKLSEGLIAEEGDLNIHYEDSAILMIHKPFGQKTIPSFQHRTGTIANFVAGKFLKENIPSTVHVVTRLDSDTSGLLCVAKNRHIHHLLSEQIKNLTFKRSYEAIVEGHLGEDNMRIDASISREEGSIIKRTVDEKGQRAVTNVRVLNRLEKNGELFTHIALQLETGRTHQIRVHMMSIGHPLVGDDLYGGKMIHMDRQALHCVAIAFQHPLSKKEVVFKSDLAMDMEKFMSGLHKSTSSENK